MRNPPTRPTTHPPHPSIQPAIHPNFTPSTRVCSHASVRSGATCRRWRVACRSAARVDAPRSEAFARAAAGALCAGAALVSAAAYLLYYGLLWPSARISARVYPPPASFLPPNYLPTYHPSRRASARSRAPSSRRRYPPCTPSWTHCLPKSSWRGQKGRGPRASERTFLRVPVFIPPGGGRYRN